MAESKIRIARLTTAPGCAKELSAVYKLARYGTIHSSDAARLASILTAIKQCLETSALETRIDGVERALGLGRPVIKLIPRDVKP
jgi:hypothetical protein